MHFYLVHDNDAHVAFWHPFRLKIMRNIGNTFIKSKIFYPSRLLKYSILFSHSVAR